MGDVESLPDLAVRLAARSHLRDLKLLWRELIPRRHRSSPARLAGCTQLSPRSVTPRGNPEGVEGFDRSSQL
jgi:hypothetical protein